MGPTPADPGLRTSAPEMPHAPTGKTIRLNLSMPPSGEKVTLDVELTNIVDTGNPLAGVGQTRFSISVRVDVASWLQPGIRRDGPPVVPQGCAPGAVPDLIDHLRSARGTFDHLITLPIPMVPTGSAQHEVKQPSVA